MSGNGKSWQTTPRPFHIIAADHDVISDTPEYPLIAPQFRNVNSIICGKLS